MGSVVIELADIKRKYYFDIDFLNEVFFCGAGDVDVRANE